jgi:hypothetical protein
MLICNVSLHPRHAISVQIAETALAIDAMTTGLSVLATLVDDPTVVIDTVDAYRGQLLDETALADDNITGALSYATIVADAASANDTINATIIVGANTWNSADKTANVVLSNGNLTADVGSATGHQGVRSIGGRASGKFYFEITVVNHQYNQGQTIGIATSTTSLPGLTTGANPGAGGSAMLILNSGSAPIYVNGSNVGDLALSVANGDVACVAVDLINQRIWFRSNNNNWNNDASANPATNVNGKDISAVFASATAYAVLAGNFVAGGGMVMTANFGGTAFAYTPPSGFVAGP